MRFSPIGPMLPFYVFPFHWESKPVINPNSIAGMLARKDKSDVK